MHNETDPDQKPDYKKYVREIMSGKMSTDRIPAIIQDLTEHMLGPNGIDHPDDAPILLELAQFMANKSKPTFATVNAAFIAYENLIGSDNQAADRAFQLWQKTFRQLPDDKTKIDLLMDMHGAVDHDKVTKENLLAKAYAYEWNAIPDSDYKTAALQKRIKQDDEVEGFFEHVEKLGASLTAEQKAHMIEMGERKLQIFQEQKKDIPKSTTPETKELLKKFREWATAQKGQQNERSL